MKHGILFTLVMFLMIPMVDAGVPRESPPLADTALANFLDDLAAHLNTLECLTVNPDGSVLGKKGDVKCAVYDSRYNICLNTSDGPNAGTSWQCFDVAGRDTACAVVEDFAAADDNLPLGSYEVAITLQNVWCTCSGTCSTVAQTSLEDGSGNAMTHTTPVCTAIGTIPTAQTITAGGGLSARESLRVDVDNTPSPETDTYEICWAYTRD